MAANESLNLARPTELEPATSGVTGRVLTNIIDAVSGSLCRNSMPHDAVSSCASLRELYVHDDQEPAVGDIPRILFGIEIVLLLLEHGFRRVADLDVVRRAAADPDAHGGRLVGGEVSVVFDGGIVESVWPDHSTQASSATKIT